MLIKAKPFQKDFFVLVNPVTINYIRRVVRIVDPQKLVVQRDISGLSVQIAFGGRFELYAGMRLNNGDDVEALVATWDSNHPRHKMICEKISWAPSPDMLSPRALVEVTHKTLRDLSEDIEIIKEVEQWLQSQM